MIVAAAGPLSNVGLAILAAIPFRLGLMSGTASFASSMLEYFILINLVLFFFNIIPIFPLDGEKVLSGLLPPSGQAVMAQVRPYGPILLILLIALSFTAGVNVLGFVVGGPAQAITHFLIS
jgi:Zn-dependent protease